MKTACPDCHADLIQRKHIIDDLMKVYLPDAGLMFTEVYQCGAIRLYGWVEGDGVARTCPSKTIYMRDIRADLWNTVRVRILNVCEWNSLGTLQAVAAFGRQKFLSLERVGDGCVNCLDEVLAMHGLQWAKP